ncbi:MAG: hypothetical protein M3439_00135 [Chloroflexota bacterium]|nr:hypothetical protein [Chloroflexota bacterium]
MTHSLVRRRFHYHAAIATCLLLVLLACGGEDMNRVGDAPSPTASAAAPPPTIPRDNLPAPVERAIEAAASDAGIDTGDVGLIAFSEEQWNDTSLGCPQPDGMYAQVITPGYDVRLLVDGNELEYHTDMDAAVVRCGA